jgi:hypothetical protein
MTAKDTKSDTKPAKAAEPEYVGMQSETYDAKLAAEQKAGKAAIAKAKKASKAGE